MNTQNKQQSENVTDWGNAVYDGLSDIGSFGSSLILYIGLFVYFIAIIVGIYMIIHDNEDEYIRVIGSVIQSSCVKSSSIYEKKDIQIDNYKCTVGVSYKIDDKEYTKNIFISGQSSTYIKDEPIELIVLKTDYTNVKIAQISKSDMGSVIIIFGFGILIISYINYYLASKYKLFSASQGVGTLASFVI